MAYKLIIQWNPDLQYCVEGPQFLHKQLVGNSSQFSDVYFILLRGQKEQPLAHSFSPTIKLSLVLVGHGLSNKVPGSQELSSQLFQRLIYCSPKHDT